MYSKSGVGYVLVVTNATHKAETGRRGIDGKELIIDIAWNPMQYAFNHATVHQLPVEMGSQAIKQIYPGVPGYGPIRRPPNLDYSPSSDLYAIGNVYQYKTMSDIEPDVRIGDKIYFKPRTLNSVRNYMGALKGKDGKIEKYIYKVPYENIFCAVQEGKINMIGGWVLLEPLMEDWEDVVVKTYYDYVDNLGQKIERPKSEWIYKKVAPETENQRAVVAHISKPLKGDPCDIEVGHRVFFRKQKKTFFQQVEGKKYIVLTQDHLLCQLVADVKVKD